MDQKRTAVVFPGQGAQRPGMGRDFYDEIPESRHAYEEAADCLGWDVSGLCFSEDERLNLTEYTQPCIVTTEIAMLRGLASRYGFSASFFGGHSLGEFTALVASGALPFGEAVRIVQARGRLMQGAVPPGVGAMTAVIAEDLDSEAVAGCLQGLAVDVANINSPRQLVLSGEAAAVAESEVRLAEALKDRPDLRFVRLNVSAPFHSRLMSPILESFSQVLQELGKGLEAQPAASVTSNYRGGFHEGPAAAVREALILQISHAVRWRANMAALAAEAERFVEIGPARPLKDFFRTIGVDCASVTTLASAERAFTAK